MMKLTTKSLGITDAEPDNMAVAWRVGINRRGIVIVTGISIQSDRAVAAELIAIRYLLFSKNVFNNEIITGKGIAIDVSSPLIKKLYRNKTTKRHLNPYAHFLKTNLTDALLTISKADDEHLPALTDNVPVEHINATDQPLYDVISTPAIGDVRITKHSIDQYTERQHSGEAKSFIASLVKRLKHPNLQQQKIPDRVTQHKLKRYGDIEQLEVWGHDSSQMHFVVVRDPHSKIGSLVTVYRRHPAYSE
jgi:hypothetical protein